MLCPADRKDEEKEKKRERERERETERERDREREKVYGVDLWKRSLLPDPVLQCTKLTLISSASADPGLQCMHPPDLVLQCTKLTLFCNAST